MPRGRSMPELKVSADERETLERWARRPTTAQALAQRARMILACAEGRPNDQVARVERVTRQLSALAAEHPLVEVRERRRASALWVQDGVCVGYRGHREIVQRFPVRPLRFVICDL